MKPYRNISGASGVVAYDIHPDSIEVRFANGTTYVYDVRSVGRRDLAQMKKLAVAGTGLSTFIAQHVHDRFASKY